MTQLAEAYQIQSCQTDVKSRNEIILEHLPMVKYVANRIAGRLPNHIEVDDLVNTGVIGLIDAIEKFDPKRKIKFRTYAEFRVKGAILDDLRSLDWVPRSTRRKATRLERAYGEIEQSLGRAATDFEVAQYLNIDIREFHRMLAEAKGISLISLDELRKDNDEYIERNLLDFLADPESLDPAQLMNLDQIYRVVSNAIDQLPEKERLAISLYYYDELTMKEIGEIMEITESRVSQIHAKAIIRLRSKLVNLLEF